MAVSAFGWHDGLIINARPQKRPADQHGPAVLGAQEVGGTETEVVRDVADDGRAAADRRIAPADARSLRMHHSEAVVRRVPELTDAIEGRTISREELKERLKEWRKSAGH